jgi:hypothetical protein
VEGRWEAPESGLEYDQTDTDGVPDYKLQPPKEQPLEYARLRVWIIYGSPTGSEDREEAVTIALNELQSAISRLGRTAAWVEIEDYEVDGFERE